MLLRRPLCGGSARLAATLALWVLLLACLTAPGICAEPPPWAAKPDRASQRDLQTVTIPEAPPTLSLQDALRLGFANNARFRSEVAGLLDAESNLRVVRQLWDLTLAGSTEKTHPDEADTTSQTSAEALLGLDLRGGATISLSATLSRLDSEESKVLGLSVLQPLLRGAGRSSARDEALRRAYNSYRQAVLGYFLARQELALSIITGYFGVVQAKQQVAIQKQGVDQADRAVKDAEARLKEGMTTKIEVTRAQLSQASRRLALNTATLSYLDRMDGFLQTLGLKVGAVAELSTQPIFSPIAPEIEPLVAEALQNRAELVIEELSLENAAAALRLSRNRAKPSLDLFGSSASVSNGGDGTEWTAGVRTSIPIGSRALREAVRSAERGWLVERRDREELLQSIATEVREDARGLQSQEERIRILGQSLEVAREKLRLANISVDEGIGLYRDKIEAQEEVTGAERDLLDAQIAYYFGVLTLRRAVGRDVLQGIAQETREAEPAPAAAPEATGAGHPAAPPPAEPEPAPSETRAGPGL